MRTESTMGPEPLTVEVVIPVPLTQTFTYMVPREWDHQAVEGCRVLVEFGNRHLQGVIAKRNPSPPAGRKLKPLVELLDKVPSLSEEMLRFTRWLADYYCCSWGEAVRAMLPSGIESGRLFVVRRGTTNGTESSVPGASRIASLLEEAGPLPLPDVRKKISGLTRHQLNLLEEEGVIAIETQRQLPRVKTRYVEEAQLVHTDPSTKQHIKGDKQRKILKILEQHAPSPVKSKELLYRATASRASLQSLEQKGLVRLEKTEMIRTPVGALASSLKQEAVPPLYPAQAEAVRAIEASIDREKFETFLLQGITGSGKTRVYIEVLKRVLEKGKSAIVLVPEIALTPQTVQRFQRHFGDQIAVLHSRMSPGERYDSWRHIKKGTFRIVIGPRSAVLAPLKHIGLIVVDEEHETSYKQYDPAPRYHARDAAVMRASINNAICILGSATPSLESYLNAHDLGKYTLLRLSERAPLAHGASASLPSIKLINLAVARHAIKKGWSLSVKMVEAIQERLEKKEQIILLQNRRGYAPVLECQECGWTPECQDCSITLTYHKTKRHMRCHYCGRVEKPAQRCPHCQSAEIEFQGVGTQRVEEELATRIPEARVLRMDMDTTSKKNAHHRILEAFGNMEADILLGTQMVAKGLHFERVTLVGVINADAGLLLPDFRTDERTFQLLTQVAGRSGRAGTEGEVLLQTRNPEHPVIRHAIQQDIDGFARNILVHRQNLGYPPYGRVVRIECKGPDEQKVARLARKWLGTLTLQEGVDVHNPQPAYLGRAKKLYRYQIILKIPRSVSAAQIRKALQANQHHHSRLPKGYRIAIDIDPVGLF